MVGGAAGDASALVRHVRPRGGMVSCPRGTLSPPLLGAPGRQLDVSLVLAIALVAVVCCCSSSSSVPKVDARRAAPARLPLTHGITRSTTLSRPWVLYPGTAPSFHQPAGQPPDLAQSRLVAVCPRRRGGSGHVARTAGSVHDVLRLTASPEAIPADGVSRTTITGRIPAEARLRTIVFQTSLGTLLSGERRVPSQTGNLSVDADFSGVATLQLQSAAIVGTARVTATITLASAAGSQTARTYARYLDVGFSPVDLERFMTVSADRVTLPADGASRAVLTAQLLFDGDRQKPITFSTSRGLLFRVGSENSEAMPTVPADASGVARIRLQADSSGGVATVVVSALGICAAVGCRVRPLDSLNGRDLYS